MRAPVATSAHVLMNDDEFMRELILWSLILKKRCKNYSNQHHLVSLKANKEYSNELVYHNKLR